MKPTERTPGYAGNGLSKYSRANARRNTDWTPRLPRKRAQPRALIITTEDQVAALRKRLRTCSTTERDKIMKAIDIKMRFLDRLNLEIAAE